MDTTYLRFLADPIFYDERTRVSRGTRFTPSAERSWDGWEHVDDGHWSGWHPAGVRLPQQGWKIHVTATPDMAAGVVQRVSEYCNDHRLAFKHLSTRHELFLRNGKDADRTASGKFITIYPCDVGELHTTLTELDAVLSGTQGPRVLSDLQWRSGPLSVRYGAFARAWIHDETGRALPAIGGPDGEFVEDRRVAAFTPPVWAAIPDFLQAEIDALGEDVAPEAFPYTVTAALHFSNAGGVYEAEDRDGVTVVIKEGRPHAGLTGDHRDAVARLVDEERALRALAGPGIVPVREAIELHGHRFLVLERVPGATLTSEVTARNPSVHASASAADALGYRQWALGIADRLDAAVARIHASGFVHGDLHPGNVLVDEDGSIVLLDFEMAHPIGEHRDVVIGAPGFVAADGRTGREADRYALACLKLFLFVPLTTLLTLDRLKVDELLDAARSAFALDAAWLARIRGDIVHSGQDTPESRSALAHVSDAAVRAWRTESEDELHLLQMLIGRSIAASADAARADRLWPGDPRQFTEHRGSLAHGAGGVIHALDRGSLDIDPQALEWFDAISRGVLDGGVGVGNTGGTPGGLGDDRLGLYDGAAGIAWLRRDEDDRRVVEATLARLRAVDPTRHGSDLSGGLPGFGLFLLGEAGRDRSLVGVAADLGAELAHRIASAGDVPSGEPARTGSAGLMWGPSGTALFALRLYEQTGDQRHLRLAIDAVERDLARCVTARDGSLQVNEGWRLMPYLASGSAGIGLVLAQLLPHLSDPERAIDAIDGIRLAASAPFVVEPGLFHGRAGLIHALTLLGRMGHSTPESDLALTHHVDALRLHAVRHGTGIGFPGHQLLRLSCDLATGSAGVLTALQAYDLYAFDEDRPGWDALLPFLLPAAAASCTSAAHSLAGRG